MSFATTRVCVPTTCVRGRSTHGSSTRASGAEFHRLMAAQNSRRQPVATPQVLKATAMAMVRLMVVVQMPRLDRLPNLSRSASVGTCTLNSLQLGNPMSSQLLWSFEAAKQTTGEAVGHRGRVCRGKRRLLYCWGGDLTRYALI